MTFSLFDTKNSDLRQLCIYSPKSITFDPPVQNTLHI